ncbi:hypothetical protein PsorP6_006870 [Peronosclerospora sorghi]|uniref:Uncharacterized protein n=1 Tax=Peronosclerospora sorghi TaxID=230839 RepID=A0ACC0WCB8_9STRA|nr:hypothetical protein PsorP6_006870 [Peronosclerospora sorghi]
MASLYATCPHGVNAAFLCYLAVSDKKRKDNLTAEAERGTLKVKILRQDEQPASMPDAPPRPRPNRKHVPIFYQPQFRQPIQRGGSHNSKAGATPLISSRGGSEHCLFSSSMKESAATATSSVKNLSNQATRCNGKEGDNRPETNPLFPRNDSDGLDLFRGLLPSVITSGSEVTATVSYAGAPVDRTPALPSALHQLASSSASYPLAIDEFSTDSRLKVCTTSSDDSCVSSVLVSSASPTTTSMVEPDTSHDHDGAQDGLTNHRFSALQTAIDHARRASQQTDETCEFRSMNKSSCTFRNNEKPLMAARVEPLPEVSPSIMVENACTGGGISSSTFTRTHPDLHRQQLRTHQADKTAQDSIGALMHQSKTHASLNRPLSIDRVTGEDSGTSECMGLIASSAIVFAPEPTSDTEKAIDDLGPPPSEPPAFTIGNSLIGGGIELQPAVTNVNRNDFDWKLHPCASNS